MDNIRASLQHLLALDGAICAAIIDTRNGEMLSHVGNELDLEAGASSIAAFLRAEIATMTKLNLNDFIEDVVVTYGHQYHILSPISKNNERFLYFVVDKTESNLGLARREVQNMENILAVNAGIP